MTKTRRVLVWSGAGIAGAVLAALFFRSAGRANERVSGLPSTKRVTYQLLKKGEVDTSHVFIGPGRALVDGQPVTSTDVARSAFLQSEVRKVWALRQTTLPKNANRTMVDAYSKELYWAPGWLWSGNTITDPVQLSMQSTGVLVDEFGRAQPGTYGRTDNSIWGSTLGGLLKNPLFRTVAIAALVASGPEGMAVYGAYTMWENRGKSLKDAAVSTGRAYAVSQCGPACGVAFDFGVGVASGKSYNHAAEDAMLQELTPQQREQYRLGKTGAAKLGVA